MDIDQLIAFERIVREGSFSRAAWQLGLAQPTVSARVQALERALGGPLFSRGGRRVTLTALGASFLPYARRALEVLTEGAEAARQAQAGQRGRVTLGVLGSLSGAFLAPALAHFRRQHPQVECLLRAADHEQIVELLCDGVVELGLIVWPCVTPPQADLLPLLHLRETVVLVASPTHPLAGRGPLTQAEVANESRPLMPLRWWPSIHSRIARVAAQAESLLEVPMETARHLLLGGVGAAFFTRTLVAA
jgi:DNA-binding transcriptional LysR family regulator